MPNKWFVQRDNCCCGPVAYLNVRLWLGHKVSYEKDIPVIKEQMGTTEHGTKTESFAEVLNELTDVDVVFEDTPTVDIIRRALRKGHVIVVREIYWDGKGFISHLFLVGEYHERSDSFLCVNVGRGHRWVNTVKFKDRYLQRHWEAPMAWIVKRKH